MRVLIVNKFFYPRGGDCIVAMNTKRLLESNGHIVRVFAMSYPENLPLPDAATYASRIDFADGIKGKIKALQRIVGMGDIRKTFNRVLEEFRPDVVHLNNIHSYLSPYVGEAAHKFGAKVVWTIHDLKLVCPAYICRKPDGQLCNECQTKPTSVIKNKCMKGSLLQSAIAYIEAAKWNRKKLESFTDAFIAPSEFMRKKMIAAGFSAEKIITICNFLDPEKSKTLAGLTRPTNESDYFCYIGRLSPEKGVNTLVEAAAQTGIKLKLAGDGPLKEELQQNYSSHTNIEFLGHLQADKVIELLSLAKASVMPSECYENNPLGVIESLSAGTPVIGANIGGIPELISDKSGKIFESGNVADLIRILSQFKSPGNETRDEIARYALQNFSEKAHYEKLMQVYNK